ncbi:hypothetical protein COLO4_33077 [Corchorus olitorius]|uniref:Uncharacterized protein n=1 Tax=Corchorus olitorius TaxID=93759 RepID=A0A1R3GWF0_9ROSI|nr:hypothetical protein COLO4_33077 [Corchorus olitorius]
MPNFGMHTTINFVVNPRIGATKHYFHFRFDLLGRPILRETCQTCGKRPTSALSDSLNPHSNQIAWHYRQHRAAKLDTYSAEELLGLYVMSKLQ